MIHNVETVCKVYISSLKCTAAVLFLKYKEVIFSVKLVGGFANKMNQLIFSPQQNIISIDEQIIHQYFILFQCKKCLKNLPDKYICLAEMDFLALPFNLKLTSSINPCSVSCTFYDCSKKMGGGQIFLLCL